jgi:hypothetical protein
MPLERKSDMTLSEQLRALVAEHNLTALSIEVHRRDDGTTYFCSYAHASPNLCVHNDYEMEDDASPQAVITSAIETMNEKRRSKPVIVSDMEGL